MHDTGIQNIIPESRRKKLDMLFNALTITSDNAYIFACDMEYDFSRWSKHAIDAFNLPSEYMYNASAKWEERIHPEDRHIFHQSIEDIFNGNDSSHDMQYRAKKIDGEYIICTCRGTVLKTDEDDPDYFIGIIKHHNTRSHVDSLTGFRNQYGFFEDLQFVILKNSPIRVCLVGINKFTEINEIYGYHFGNMVIQKFGRHLMEFVGDKGSVYRMDGTKFAIITSTMSVEDITDDYELLRAHFREGIMVDQKAIYLEINGGLFDLDNFLIEDQIIYSCLNFAYSESKTKHHGDLVEFFNDITAVNREQLQKIHTIRASIKQDYNGFFLVYQPVVDSYTEKLIGAEALLRWKSDEYGEVAPDTFVPIIEGDPLFPELGRWIMRTALIDAKRMLEAFPGFIININLSYTQLESPGFTDTVYDLLHEIGFPPEHMCLEITERCRLLNITLLKDIVVNFRSNGIKVALDDFGTGFSSIGIVKELPFDTIKIDKSFVSDIEQSDQERELIGYFTGAASTFGAKVCVEGIETSGMRDILKRYRVQSFQGYYYSKPLDIEDLLKWKDEEHRKVYTYAEKSGVDFCNQPLISNRCSGILNGIAST